MLRTPPPTDQRAGVRPIAFVLQNAGNLGKPVTLKVRPEDLTRTEPSRVSIHQTLGVDTQGWVDHFGEGLPTLNISGHTGWRSSAASGMDGVQAFEALNQLVAHEYPTKVREAINAGLDPSLVKLLFVDMLDSFTYSVVPQSFVLRRSKSRPLLIQYNIAMQAISASIDNPLMILPFAGNLSGGLKALAGAISTLKGFSDKIKGWVSDALKFKDALLTPIAATIKTFTDMSTQVFEIVHGTVTAINNGVSSTANSLIGMAGDIAQVGVNVYRTLSSIASLPSHLRSAIGRVASAFTEVVCIFANSLKPKKQYDDYDGLYGASNCSSTSGGRGPSSYANMNAFALMQEQKGPVSMTNAAMAGVSSINRADPVLAPISIPEMGRNVDAINSGVTINKLEPDAVIN